jgi:hypothetical protein
MCENRLGMKSGSTCRRRYSIKIETLKQRLDRDRPITSVTIRIPEDVVEDLKRVAPLLVYV